MDSTRNAFENFFMPIQIFDDMPKDEKQVLYKEIEDFCAKQVPQTLYRYRDCSKWSIQAFNKNQLYMSNANAFNDPYDSLPYFEEEKLPKPFNEDEVNSFEHEIELILTNEAFRKKYAEKYNISEQQLLEEFSNPVKNKFELLKMQSLFFATNRTRKIFISIFKKIHREFARIACFSEYFDSILMWSHYSNFHKGFVLEYNTTDLIKTNENSSSFEKAFTYPLPIIYTKNRFNITNELEINIKNNFNKRYNLKELPSDILNNIVRG